MSLDSVKFGSFIKSVGLTGAVNRQKDDEYNQKGLTSQGYSDNYLNGRAPYQVASADNMGLDYYA